MNRTQLIAIAILLGVLGVGYWVRKQGGAGPFQAQESEPFDPFEEAVTGRVGEIGENRLEIRVYSSGPNPPRYTILLTSDTEIIQILPDHRLLQFADIELGDRVVVYPTERRTDFTRQADFIDVFKE